MDHRIIHVDMDAFFAAVEQQDQPELKGKAVIVGGSSNRGIVCTCSYEARKFGIHSAMPIFMAKQRCPHGIYLPVRHERYREVSRQVFDILYEVTDLVEPLSIDEAFLDISDCEEKTYDIAKYIKEQVNQKTGLTISVGISYNKFLAKLASDWNKPDGIKIITKEMVPDILKPLPVHKVFGIGRKSGSKLNQIGIETIEDLLSLSEQNLIDLLGKSGVEIYHRIRGVDQRMVEIDRQIKSIGRETTLTRDTMDKEELKKYLFIFAQEVSQSLKRRGFFARTITIKMKDAHFKAHSKGKTIEKYIRDEKEIYEIASEALEENGIEEYIRLIGLTVSNFSTVPIEQLTFYDTVDKTLENASKDKRDWSYL
ncbi:DNA-directed DNA polymerase [Alkaliphilus metalliredigens QYMF]|uniref:DNA polymerase IV n=2 Tax=Alkaliphilus TaxID=114627 RepID=A6TVS8_ALKMQ|nr:DNA-directed DNA polymerase [Alkaliphilus metalliredigens QYMF]